VHPATFLLLGVLLAAGLSGCGGNATPPPGSPTIPSETDPILMPTVTITEVSTPTSTATVVTISATPTCTLTPAPAPPSSPTPAQTSVHVSTIFETSIDGQYKVDVNAGIGTIVDIDKRVILTHNHYGKDDPDLQIEKAWALRITDSLGNSTQVNNFDLIEIDAGALLIDLANDEITFSQKANLGNPNNVSVGDEYTTVYWSGSGFVKFDTVVEEVRSQLFVMSNLNDIIRDGDSGGGGFVNNQLVGVTWSMTNLETFQARKLPDNLQAEINTAK
jgi:hypothetical protein